MLIPSGVKKVVIIVFVLCVFNDNRSTAFSSRTTIMSSPNPGPSKKAPSGYVFIATSIDGFIADSKGSVNWLNEYQGSHPLSEGDDGGFGAFLDSVDVILMGRKTFATVNEIVDTGVAPWPYGDKPLYILTSNLDNVKVCSQLKDKVKAITGHDPETVLRAISAATGAQNVYIDGGSTIRSFLEAGLITKAIVTVVPVKLGDGVPLFTEQQRMRLRQADQKTFPMDLLKSHIESNESTEGKSRDGGNLSRMRPILDFVDLHRKRVFSETLDFAVNNNLASVKPRFPTLKMVIGFATVRHPRASFGYPRV